MDDQSGVQFEDPLAIDFPLVTRTYTTFVGERLGYEYEDVSKTHTTWDREGRPDDILDHARPVYEANRLSDMPMNPPKPNS